MSEFMWMIFAVQFPLVFIYLIQKFFLPDGTLFTRKTKPKEEYKEYETSYLLDEIWFDNSKTGTCATCGCSDTPIYGPTYGALLGPICKWCLELDNLSYHLRTTGQQRFKKDRWIDIQTRSNR